MSPLHRAGQRAAAHPFFLAFRLSVYQQAQNLGDEQLAEALNCSLDALARLRLCRMPITEEDLVRVAAHAQGDAGQLADLLQLTTT
jgi:hypothetical protein